MLIPLFGKSILSKSANVTAQSRVNLYVEIPADRLAQAAETAAMEWQAPRSVACVSTHQRRA